MPKAEGRVIEWKSEEAIQTGWLEVLPYQGEPQMITYTTEEFSAVCPFSGLPDYGRLTVRYVPNERLVELKSLKYYIVSFRQVGIYQENALIRIYKDLTTLLNPRYLKVTLEYNQRGGIKAFCEKSSASDAFVEKLLHSHSIPEI